jgi:hypothetical protein
VQQKVNCAYEAVKLGEFHQMIKSMANAAAVVLDSASIVKYREIWSRRVLRDWCPLGRSVGRAMRIHYEIRSY